MDGARQPVTLDVLVRLRQNAHLGKYKHFEASKRSQLAHALFGVPVVVINVGLGSTFFVMLSNELPDTAKWAGAILAFLAATFSGVQTFFNFRKAFEGHRQVGNQYLVIAKECERLEAAFVDGLMPLDQLNAQLTALNERYDEINRAAENLPTTDRDYYRALNALEDR